MKTLIKNLVAEQHVRILLVVLLGLLMNTPYEGFAGEIKDLENKTIQGWTEGFENGMPSGWTVIDGNNDGWTWCMTSAIPTTWIYYASLPLDWYRTGTNAICSGSYINGVGTLTPDEYLVTVPVAPAAGSTFSFWAAATDASYAADHFGVFVSANGTSNWTMLNEWTLTGKNGGTNGGRASRDGNGAKLGNWYNYTVDLSSYAGQTVYLAIRHFNCTDQYIMCVDDIELTTIGDVYDFEDGTLQGWTNIDADGDGNVWASSVNPGIYHQSGINLAGTGHNASQAYVISGSYANQTAQVLTPDNYLVSPTKATYSSVSFWACAQDASYAADHFGVAVSTTTATASAFTTVQEWTMTAKGNVVPAPGRCGDRAQGNWYHYSVDLSAYAGQNIWLAIRHFNCTDMFILNVDDITLGEGSPVSSYVITASANPTNGGAVSGAGSYSAGASCTLTATPATGYTFTKWTKNGTQVSTNPTYTFTVTASASYVAVFTQNSYTISATANPSNGGTVSGGGSYSAGASCTLTATPATGYTFTKWTKNGTQVSNSASYTFTVNANTAGAYVAVFTQNSYSISASANPPAGGTVSGEGTYNYGASCTLTATPAAGYTFSKWRKNATQVSTNPIYTFTVTASASYVAVFTLTYYTIGVSSDPGNGGSVNGGGNYTYGQSCTLTATPNDGYVFDKWTKDGASVSTNPVFTISVSENANYVAHFMQSINNYTITASADPIAGGTVSGSGTYQQGSSCVLTAVPNDGYAFANWTKDGTIVSTNPSFTITVTENSNYVAHFTMLSNDFIITVNSNPLVGGIVDGGGTFSAGATCTVTAVANEGYSFANWTENGVVVSLDDHYSFVVEGNRFLYANFNTASCYYISASAGANGSISPQGDIEVSAGGDQTFSITPNFGCRINSVFVDGVDLGSIDTYTFSNVNSNHTISAVFSGWGVEESQAFGVNLFPNPAKDHISIEGHDIAEIQFYNLQGEKVLDIKDYNEVDNVSLRNLPCGMYVVLIKMQNGNQCFSKVVITD